MSETARGILIVDLGTQYAQLIARRVREAGSWCEIHPPRTALETSEMDKLDKYSYQMTGRPLNSK